MSLRFVNVRRGLAALAIGIVLPVFILRALVSGGMH